MSKRYLLPFMIVAIAASLGSCNSNPTPTSSQINSEAPTTTPSELPPTPSQSPSMEQLRAKPTNIEPSEASKTAAPKTINVTLFTSDTQCQELIPQKVAVPAEQPVTSVIGKIINERDTADFSLSGYRVKVQNGVATVDLRLSPESKRQLASLSSCEQFALFGSLRKTLTSNPQWNIKEVRFTEKGEEIVL